jgi:hypothetical protein
MTLCSFSKAILVLVIFQLCAEIKGNEFIHEHVCSDGFCFMKHIINKVKFVI